MIARALAILFLAAASSVFGAARYVATTGSDSTGDGSLANPWRTPQYGVERTFAGDTLWIRGGTYTGADAKISLVNSGTSDGNRVVIAGYPGETPILDKAGAVSHIIRSDGLGGPFAFVTISNVVVKNSGTTSGRTHGVWINGANWVNLLNVRSTNNYGTGFFFEQTKSNLVLNCIASGNGVTGTTTGSHGFHLGNGVEYITFGTCEAFANRGTGFNLANGSVKVSNNWPYYSSFTRYVALTNSLTWSNWHQGINTMKGEHWLIRGNTSIFNGATGFQPETGSWRIYCISNTFASNNWFYPSETGLWLDETADSIFEWNKIEGNYRGAYNSQSHSNVLRFNLIARNNAQGWSSPATLTSAELLVTALGMHWDTNTYPGNIIPAGGRYQMLLHNTYVGNGISLDYDKGGWSVGADDYWQLNPVGNDDCNNNGLLLNNLFVDTLGRHEGFNPDAQNNAFRRADGNLYWNTNRPARFRHLLSDYTFSGWKSASGWDQHSIEADPKLVNPAAGDFTLASDSPAIDSGQWLAYTSGGGSGTTIPVDNALPFFAGNAYFGLLGDLIQLAGQTTTARVTARTFNTITVDTPLSWANGQGIAYAYANTAPDIGAFEYSASYTPPPPPETPAITIAATKSSVNEAAGLAAFIVTRSGPLGALSVNVQISGTATNGVDYAALSSPVGLSSSATSTEVVLAPINDGVHESTESVTLTIIAGTGYSVGSPSSATINITDSTPDPEETVLRRQPQPGHSGPTRMFHAL